MPVTKTAKRALRGSRRKQKNNIVSQSRMEVAIRLFQKNPNVKNIAKAFSVIDKSVKTKLIHKNKAARLKSQLSKLFSPKKSK